MQTAISMPRFYNEIAGKNLERPTALSEGVFAVAITFLALDLHAKFRPFAWL